MSRRAGQRVDRAVGLRSRLPLAALGLAVLVGLGGCSDTEQRSATAEAPASAPRANLAQAAQRSALKLAYTHDLTLGMPAERVAPRFAAVRDRCLNDADLGCVLVSSSLDEGPRPSGRPQAQLQVRLPHGSVATYLAFATAPLPGEQAGDVVVRRQATRADDLTPAIEDGERRLAQRGAYRARLDALAAKPDTRVEDLVRIAQELAQVQSQIEEGEAKQRGLQQRVDTELVSLALRSDQARAGALAPVGEAWAQAGDILGASAGSALRFAIVSLPWLPLAAIGLFVLRWLWRLRRPRTPPTRGRP